MTKLFSTLALLLAVSLTAFAQDTPTMYPFTDRASEPTEDDVRRVMEGKLYLNARANAIKLLELTEDEISDFDYIMEDYNSYRNKLNARRAKLVKNYKEEMAEDDSAKDEENETADFIENFWEIDIAQMELKKDYFDKLEDKIGAERALRFFTYEDMLMNRAKRQVVREQLSEMMPQMLVLVPLGRVSYQGEMDDFKNWKKINIDGKVGLDHNFTYNGLKKLLTATEAMTRAEGITVTDFDTKKSKIMKNAEMMQKDWKSLKHADLAKESFKHTADIIGEVAMDSRFTGTKSHVEKLKMQANAINKDVKLTDQADKVYAFFNTAEMIVNELTSQANGAK